MMLEAARASGESAKDLQTTDTGRSVYARTKEEGGVLENTFDNPGGD